MRSWSTLTVLLVLVGALLAGGAARPLRAAPQSAPPNVVLIISDDQAWGDYSFMGHPHIRTPNLDRLAAQSLCFTRGYTPSSLCCPSLASIITGRYPHQHGVTSNDPPIPAGMTNAQFQRSPAFQEGREVMNRYMDQVPTLPRLLAQKGYESFQTGKWWQGEYRRGGFTHGMTHGGRHGDDGLKIGRETMQPIYDFIQGARKENHPFFVWYAPMLPHQPHNPPDRFLEKYRDKAPTLPVAKYWAMCEWFDETCGQLLGYLDQNGLTDNTVVVFLADNGWIQEPNADRFAPRSKQSQYEGGLRTPLLVRWPGKVQPRRVEQPVLSLDIVPTVCAATGVKAPQGLPGVNLLDEKARGARKAIFGECFTHNAVDLHEPASSLRWRWAIEGDWKLIVPAPQNEPDGKIELYDLARDPAEATNLASSEPDRVQRMTKLLDAWWNGKAK